MKLKKYFWVPLLFVFVLAIIIIPFLPSKQVSAAKKVIVYKSPTCGCCVNYISMLEKRGYDVEIIATEDMLSVKKQYGISPEMESCHTSIFDDYVVEGHIPFKVVDKLLEEKPDIKGIALPDMPAGSPGMPGLKSGPFTIYALSDNGYSVYLEY